MEVKTKSTALNLKTLAEAASQARGLAIDAIKAAGIGHLGLPLGATEIGAILFGHALNFNPENPRWLNRDRFVLSAGHGSMFLYAWLHLSGFNIPMEEIRNFRQLHSMTPGHPEFGDTPGVECTTGPLGQGIGNAVGMAIAAKMAGGHFNTEEHKIIDNHIVCLAGDGCIQEGITAEACSLGAHLGLDNLILIFDSNDVTLDAMADKTQSEDTAKRFEAYGFDVVTIDGHEMTNILEAYERAKTEDNGRPKLIIAKTLIGKGIPEVAGTAKAHGAEGKEFSEKARKNLGLPDEPYYVSASVKEYFLARTQDLLKAYAIWEETFEQWKSANPDKSELLDSAINGDCPKDLLGCIPHFSLDANLATRVAGRDVLQQLAAAVPLLISGSADLHGSTNNYIKDAGDFTRDNPIGRNIFFGIREHGMGAIVNGFGYDGMFRASCATFAVFSDYMRPSVRLAALAKLPVFYIWTHDSVAVGEDGPTHQPVETVSALRCIPNLDVIRPADPEETAGSYVAALERLDGPTALILTRQNVPNLNEIPIDDRRKGVISGGYIARKEEGSLKLIILASGSELQHALAAANELGSEVRVVSMPCFERFERQAASYRENVLPSTCLNRIAIEAGVTGLWYRYVSLEGKVIGIDRFGLSAPGDKVMNELGIRPESIIQAAREMG